MTAKIVVIIDAFCMSATLDFIDTLKSIDQNIILLGESTDADSVYMEIRIADLPSGKGQFQFPIKMYRNRLRGHNVPYVPDMPYPQTITLPAEKDAWLLETISKL